MNLLNWEVSTKINGLHSRLTQHICCVVLPMSFDPSGNLPAGIHQMTWPEVVATFGTTSERQRLLTGCLRALRSLRDAGCRCVYLDGSFVTDKEGVYGTAPGDFDGCWETAGVDPDRLDPVLLQFANQRAAQKAKFFGELFPASLQADPVGQTYLQFLQTDKHTGKPKGIVQLDLKDLP